MHQGRHTGFTDAGVDGIDLANLKPLDHAGGGVDLFKAQFGVRMQVAAKGGEFGVKGCDVRKGATMRQGAKW
jgi:hypothetical protein